LRQGLTDRGYVVGRNLMIEERYAEGNPHRIPVLIDQLLALSIDVLVTPGTPITRAAQRATTTVTGIAVALIRVETMVSTSALEQLLRCDGQVA